MITIDGVQYRNLEEQVKKNKDDIQYILEEEGVLNQFGIKIVGEVDTTGDLPDPTTYEGEFGDAYAVGTTTPYTLYIYTRANGSHATNYWFNIGQFPLPGPQGGPGPAGEDGATGLQALQDMGHRTTSSVPIIGQALGTSAVNFNRTPIVGDTFFQLVMGLNGTSAEGRTWITNNEITSIGSLYNFKITGVLETTGAQGPQGNPGQPGAPGQQGPQGPIGPQGNPGQSFVIAGTVANEGQLPDPSTVADNIAYLVGTAAPYDLYVQLQDSSEWFNAGIVEGVQGPQGPQGPMPPLVNTRGDSTTDAISQQGIENIFYNSSVVLGQGATSVTGINNRSITIGYQASQTVDFGATGIDTIVIGANATSDSGWDVVIGGGATSSGFQGASVVVGSNSETESARSVVIGVNCNVGTNSLHSLAIGSQANIGDNSWGAVAIGMSAGANAGGGIAVGRDAKARAKNSIAIGLEANTNATAVNGIQLGKGWLGTPDTFQVGNYPLLDLTTGFIPSDRLPDTTIPVANSTTLGGVMPVTKTSDMTQEVGVDSTGKLYTAPGSGGGGVSGDYLPLTGGNISGALAVHANTTDKNSMLIVRNNADYLSTVVLTTNGTRGESLGPAIFIGPDGDLSSATASGFSGIRMDMGGWKLVDYGPQDIKFTFAARNTLTYSGTGFQINNPQRIANIAFPNTGSGNFTLATTSQIPAYIRFTYNGGGQYVTASYVSPTPIANGPTSISALSTSINSIGASLPETMIPASGQYNSKQVIGLYSINDNQGINIIFTDGTSEELSGTGTTTVTTITPPTQTTLTTKSAKQTVIKTSVEPNISHY